MEIDYAQLPDFPKKLFEKLKDIREKSRLTADEFAPHVGVRNGNEILDYERGQGDLSVRVLLAYSKLRASRRNFAQDDRDLWFGHRQN